MLITETKQGQASEQSTFVCDCLYVTSACFPSHCSPPRPDVVLRISRPKINWSPIPQSRVRQDHCKTHVQNTCIYMIKDLFISVCVCVYPLPWKGVLRTASLRRWRAANQRRTRVVWFLAGLCPVLTNTPRPPAAACIQSWRGRTQMRRGEGGWEGSGEKAENARTSVTYRQEDSMWWRRSCRATNFPHVLSCCED